MNPAHFPESNVVFGLGQPEYLGLPVLARQTPEGHVTSCWHMTEEEFQEITRTRKVFVTVLTFYQPLQPQMVTVGVPEL